MKKWAGTFSLLTLIAVAGCDINDRENRVDTRALHSPVEQSSSQNERQTEFTGVPLVTADLPNNPKQPVKVRTAIDNITGTPTETEVKPSPSGPPQGSGASVDIRELPQSQAVPPATQP